uniref:Uncharacterized protein n=1 Tax=Oryza brachyantha TaxID=4533 RepID=J3LI75_ORYBR
MSRCFNESMVDSMADQLVIRGSDMICNISMLTKDDACILTGVQIIIWNMVRLRFFNHIFLIPFSAFNATCFCLIFLRFFHLFERLNNMFFK